jgi:hypothetical protein
LDGYGNGDFNSVAFADGWYVGSAEAGQLYAVALTLVSSYH